MNTGAKPSGKLVISPCKFAAVGLSMISTLEGKDSPVIFHEYNDEEKVLPDNINRILVFLPDEPVFFCRQCAR